MAGTSPSVMASKKRQRDESTSEHPRPVIVFAHGAGAPSSSPWMLRWKQLLVSNTNAVAVMTFDYPYCAGGKKGAPPKAEKLMEPHLQEVKKAASQYPGHPVVLVGKSMGSRVSCMVAGHEDVEVAAVICFGYPLKGTKGALRDQTLFDLKVPVMFVQGTKDGLCPLEKLEEARKKMTVMSTLHIIEGGDHSLKVPVGVLKKRNASQKDIEQQAVNTASDFLKTVLGTSAKV